MVGRKLKEGEEILAGVEQQHTLSQDIFHESAENFDQGIKQNEGVLKYYSRHLYAVFGILAGVTFAAKVYLFSFELLIRAEDTLDELLFEFVKRKRPMEVKDDEEPG